MPPWRGKSQRFGLACFRQHSRFGEILSMNHGIVRDLFSHTSTHLCALTTSSCSHRVIQRSLSVVQQSVSVQWLHAFVQ